MKKKEKLKKSINLKPKEITFSSDGFEFASYFSSEAGSLLSNVNEKKMVTTKADGTKYSDEFDEHTFNKSTGLYPSADVTIGNLAIVIKKNE